MTTKTKHTALPWHWWAEDHSMINLTGPDRMADCVLWCSPCENCQKEGESPIGKCGCPSEANAAFIVRACNNHYQLLEALNRIKNELRGIAEEDLSRAEKNILRHCAAIKAAEGK